jgi:hypothetical protein
LKICLGKEISRKPKIERFKIKEKQKKIVWTKIFVPILFNAHSKTEEEKIEAKKKFELNCQVVK